MVNLYRSVSRRLVMIMGNIPIDGIDPLGCAGSVREGLCALDRLRRLRRAAAPAIGIGIPSRKPTGETKDWHARRLKGVHRI